MLRLKYQLFSSHTTIRHPCLSNFTPFVVLALTLYGTQTSGSVLTNKTDAQASLERIQNFEEAFARIRSATGIEDIEELVSEREQSPTLRNTDP